jgi:hypothetical protein
MTPERTLSFHQLLGRIGYFHALFIEPVLDLHPGTVTSAPARICCLHTGALLDRPVQRAELASSAWALIPRIAAQLSATPACPVNDPTCCAACTLASNSETIGATWILAQATALDADTPHDHATPAIGRVLARAFATQHDADCAALDLDTGPDVAVQLAKAHPLPLTAELLGCWADPATAPSGRLSTWLNHCSGMDDIRRITLTRSAA